MRPHGYVSDDEVIINLQGLRWVAKTDTYPSMRGDDLWELVWDFKGSTGCRHRYADKDKRDAMFQRLVDGLKEAPHA
jgi:hypothetical protein